MICPHCARTIPEEDRYLMSATAPEPGQPLIGRWGRWALVMLAVLAIVATLRVFALA